jgi:hypothetical protein
MTAGDRLRRVALLTLSPDWPFARQTPAASLRWEDCTFEINPTGGTFDFVAAYDGVPWDTTLACPPDATLLITGEPPSIKHYDARFAAQFHTVITCHTDLAHPRKLFSSQVHPWYAGVDRRGGRIAAAQAIDALLAEPSPRKDRLISVIASDKAVTAGHRHRRALVARLQAHFGDRIDVFGRGIRDIGDKADAILPYKYHVALENSEFYDYWTEKISDSFICRAMPLYWGCPNIDNYFPSDSSIRINIYDPDGAVAVIERAIAGAAYESSTAAREEARRRTLTEYNLFAVVSALCRGTSSLPPVALRLHPESRFRDSLRKRINRQLRRAVPRKYRRPAKIG